MHSCLFRPRGGDEGLLLADLLELLELVVLTLLGNICQLLNKLGREKTSSMISRITDPGASPCSSHPKH